MPLKFANNQSLTSTTALPSAVPTDNLILISTQTASDSTNISFTTGLNGTYDVYEFHFIDIHPRTDAVSFNFNMSTDSGSNYNVTKTTTNFGAEHGEGDGGGILEYRTDLDLAQSTSDQKLVHYVASDADSSMTGILQLFNPSSTTYVKHFISNCSQYRADDTAHHVLVAGYGNTTSAINAVRFQMSSGNFDGIIKLYGVKKS